MTKIQAIKKILEDNNGVATWGIIYNNIEKYYPDIKNTKEWQAGIRGVLYRDINNKTNFKQIGLGLFSFIDFKEDKIENIKDDKIRMHSYMEGICLEIGNFLNMKTYTPDKSAKFNNINLSMLATLNSIPKFTYDNIIESTKRIDVLWFNNLGYQFPKRAIEVVDSLGTLEPALKRTFQLNEFNMSVFILCKKEDISKVQNSINSEPYIRYKSKYFVRDYENIIDLYKNPMQNMNDDFFKLNR